MRDGRVLVILDKRDDLEDVLHCVDCEVVLFRRFRNPFCGNRKLLK